MFCYLYFFTSRIDSTLLRVEFIGSILTKEYKIKEFTVTYKAKDKILEVTERILLPWKEGDESVCVRYEWKDVFKVPFNKPTITPTNFKDKLPLLISLS